MIFRHSLQGVAASDTIHPARPDWQTYLTLDSGNLNEYKELMPDSMIH